MAGRRTAVHLLVVAVLAGLCPLAPVLTERAEAAYPGVNGHIAYRGEGDSVWLTSPDGSQQTPFFDWAAALETFEWSPDSSMMALTHDGTNLSIVDSADPNGILMDIAGTSETMSSLSWSPDGTQLAFAGLSSDTIGSSVYVADVADEAGSTEITAVTGPEQVNPQDVAWSPDGSRIAFTSSSDPGRIYAIAPDGTGFGPIAGPFSGGVQAIDWAPDGSRLVFSHQELGDDAEIWAVDADGTNPQQLTNNDDQDSAPVFSPDGTRIAYTTSAGVGQPGYIVVMHADGSNPQVLTQGSQPSWGSFVPPPPASVSGHVFVDDGSYGFEWAPGATGIAGVTIDLSGTDELGNPVYESTTTDPDGAFAFTGLAPGFYSVSQQSQPAGYLDGPDGVGGSASASSDWIDLSAVCCQPGDVVDTVGFAEHLPSSLSGQVFQDVDTDGTYTDGVDTPIPDVEMSLWGTDDLGDTVSDFVMTDATGAWTFSGLRAGTYEVTQSSQPDGYPDGPELAGTCDGAEYDDFIGDIAVPLGGACDGYRFTEGTAVPLGSLGDRVWDDQNGDGIQDPGEPGLADVTVRLLDAFDNELDSVLTDPSGAYAFADLAAGDYRIEVVAPGGRTFSPADQGGDDQLDSDVDGSDGRSPLVSMAGVDVTDVDAGLYAPPASLSGVVFLDTDADQARGVDEPLVTGVTISLSGGSLPEPLTTVATDGTYSFTGLAPGTYTVTQTQPAGLLDAVTEVGSASGVAGTNEVTAVVLAAGDTATGYDFGEWRASSLAGQVFDDANRDLVADAGEALIGGVDVALDGATAAGASVHLTTATAPDGSFAFTGLAPGTYTVTETQPAALADGGAVAGSAAGTVGVNQVSAIALGENTSATGYRFAEWSEVRLSGRVFVDGNGDGTLDAGETPLSGQAVQLSGTAAGGGAVTRTATTAADGGFTLTVPPGTYALSETQPVGYLDGRAYAGTASGTPGTNTVTNIALTGDATGYAFTEVATSSLAGTVWDDDNGDLQVDPGEHLIQYADIELSGVDDQAAPVSVTTKTEADGTFRFRFLRPGTYTVRQTRQPLGMEDRTEAAGTAGGTVGADEITGIALPSGVDATGYRFSEYRRKGTPWSWGGEGGVDDNRGMLGSGIPIWSKGPVQVPGLADVVRIDATDRGGAAVTGTGTAFTWGIGYQGSNCGPDQMPGPTPVGLPDVTDIARTDGVTALLRSDGTVWTCGSGAGLGRGAAAPRSSTPVLVPGLTGVVELEAQHLWVFARRADGSVVGWGGWQTPSPTPSTIASGAAQLASSGERLSVRMGDGTVLANTYNEQTMAAFGPVPAPPGVVDVATYRDRAQVFLDAGGQVWDRTNGAPRAVPGMTGAVRVGMYGQIGFAIDAGGGVRQWVVPGVSGSVDIDLTSLVGAQQIDGALYSALAVGAGGTVWAAGRNNRLAFGDGRAVRRLSAGAVLGPQQIVQHDALSHVVTLAADGSVWNWGMGAVFEDQPGVSSSGTPVPIPGVTQAVDVVAGYGWGAALRADGMVAVWGQRCAGGGSSCGQSGEPLRGVTDAVAIDRANASDLAVLHADGTVSVHPYGGEPTTTRVQTATGTLAGVTVVAGGAGTSYALTGDGQVHAWGACSAGQLGTNPCPGGSTAVATPVGGLPGPVIEVVTNDRGDRAGVILADGSVRWWGRGITGVSTVPGLVGPIASLALGDDHGLAASTTGTAFGWGGNDLGQVGDGATWNRSAAVPVAGLAGVRRISAASRSSFAIADPSLGPVPPPNETGSQPSAPPGGVVNTDTEGDGATAVDPFETIVQLGSAGGPVSVTEELNDGPAPQGYGLLDYRVRITAPPGTVADPLVLTFRLDSTLLPPDLDVEDLAVLRNQVPIPACTHASSAVPDPCVAARAVLGDGDWQITVRTSAASDWEFGVAEPTAPDLGGPYTVDEGDELVLDASGATSPIGLPLTHDWIPADRVDALAGGHGRVRTDDDHDGSVEVRVRDAIGGSATAATRVTVRNVAPSIGTISLPATGSVNDPVALDAEVSDPGTADTITATVDWGDGTVEDVPFDGTRVVGHHVYATTGTRTVSVFVEDDDGGMASSGRSIDVAPAAQSGHTLWGVLRDATGAPVEGILVHALRTGGASVTCSRSDAAGVYRCPGGQGGYRLAVVGQFGFVSKYLPNGYGPNGAKVFRVGGSGHTRQDGVLYRAADTGQVAGQVSCGAVHGGYFCRSVGLAVKGATVQVYRPDGTVVVQTTTDDLGRYTIPGLEPGHYRVFVRRGVTSWAWFDDADSLGAAVEVLVERGITTVADQRLCGPGGSTCS